MNLRNEKRDLFIEFRENSMHVIDAEHGIEVPLERDHSGRLTAAGIRSASERLREFFRAHDRQRPTIACCAIPARGVLLRRLSVPAADAGEVRRLLALQLEAQLPVSPAELAWGSSPLGRNGSPMQDFVVAAIKKEILGDYTRLLADAGVAAEYTIGALTRRALCSNPPAEFGIVDGSPARSEWATFDSRGPLSLRIQSGSADTAGQNGFGGKLYVCGEPDLVARFTKHGETNVELVNGSRAPGRTVANEGLRKMIEAGREPLFLGAHEPVQARPNPLPWRWPALAAGLVLLSLGLRYAEALVYRGRLSEKSAAIARHRSSLPNVETEFNFLNFIKTNQPPYLDVLTALAVAAPLGTRLDNVSLVRHGDLSLKGSVGDAQAPGVFRSKLIESGLFTRVILEEQAPVSDGQKFTFRLSAQLKPDAVRPSFTLPKEGK